MARPTIFFDAGRLIEHFNRITPTGIDRVELAYAKEFRRLFGNRVVYGYSLWGRVIPIADGWVDEFLEATELAWRGARVGEDLRLHGALKAKLGIDFPPPRWRRCGPAGGLAIGGVSASGARRHPHGAAPAVAARPRAGDTFIGVSHMALQKDGPVRTMVARTGIRRSSCCTTSSRSAIRNTRCRRPRPSITTGADDADARPAPDRQLRGHALRRGPLRRRNGASGCRIRSSPILGSSRSGTSRSRRSRRLIPFSCASAPSSRARPPAASQRLAPARRASRRQGAPAGGGGRRGWENEQVVDMLERSRDIRDHIVECADLPDAALKSLMAGARALLFPSFVEGFGLPLAEAMAARLPVVASNIGVFRELAGIGPDYLDPLDGLGWLQAVEDYTDRSRAGAPTRSSGCAIGGRRPGKAISNASWRSWRRGGSSEIVAARPSPDQPASGRAWRRRSACRRPRSRGRRGRTGRCRARAPDATAPPAGSAARRWRGRAGP